MARNMTGPERPHTAHLHPRVYTAMAGLAVLFVLATWYGFGASSYIDYLLVIVTAFLAMVVALPLLAWRQWHEHPTRGPHDVERDTFHAWAEHDVDTFTGTTSGRSAAIEILLPLCAVAFGMLAFAILAHVMS